MAHVTGGGLRDNVPRECCRTGWAHTSTLQLGPFLPIFTLLQELSNIDSDEMYHVFNMGLGMVLACDAEDAEQVCSLAPEARVVGEVVRATGDRRVNL